MNAIITLKEYLDKQKTFVIPDYQRGYVWGKKRVGEKDSVSNLLEDLTARFARQTDVFLQGVTVTETEREIILIDGQQRTTCLFLLLSWLGFPRGRFRIKYDIRNKSDEYLKNLDLNHIEEEATEPYQDIFFFKKTLRIINDKLHDIDKAEFREFLLEHIRFLYINIPKEQAMNIFSLMNGSKARMLPEEVIKAEILRLASLNVDNREDVAQEWEQNMLRSRYAREWDKWLHWWNREDVQRTFGCSNPMGLLITTFLRQKEAEVLTFETFKDKYLAHDLPKEAKDTFDGLRRLQKRFEDAFDDPATHNRIGAILNVFDPGNRNKFIKYYFTKDHRRELEAYYLQVFLGMSHDEIVSQGSDREKYLECFETKYARTWSAISDAFLYQNNPDQAFRFLLRLNVDQDTQQNRKFNFEIWRKGARSLEHIYPKSRVGHQDQPDLPDNWLDGSDTKRDRKDFSLLRNDIQATVNGITVETSEHGIGNLVLLYKDENSVFNDSEFEVKKEIFFSPRRKELFKSRHLLHTVCVFAEKTVWDGPAIARNQYDTLEKFKSDYDTLRKKTENDEEQD